MIAQQFDIAIVGAGLAGTALATALGGSPLRIALIEAQPLSLQWPTLRDDVNGFDARVSALTFASQRWLDQLGVWELVAARRVSPYRHMHVWDGEGTGSIHFDAAEVNRPALGHIVENNLLQTALLHSLSRHHNVQIFSPVQVEHFTRGDDHIELQLQNQTQLRTKLLVGADGANSRVRDWAEIKLREHDYGHTALVATVATTQPHQSTAWQIFRREGPLAFLPLQGTGAQHDGPHPLSSIVWSTVPEEAQALMAMDDNDFMRALGNAFEHRLGDITATSRRFSFPLRARHAESYVQPSLALIGDAAHTIHPLAGQGINLGFLDAQALADELLRAAQRGLQPGDASVLARYQRSRKSDNLVMLGLMDGFKRLFGANDLTLRWLRNTGLNLTDRSGPLKRFLIRQAMGISF